MIDFFRNIPEMVKGIIATVFGLILLLYGFGIWRSRLDLIIIIAGVGMIIYGFMILNGPKKLSRIMADIGKKTGGGD